MNKRWMLVIQTVITILIFWLSDFILHFTGVGESRFYYISKLANATLFAILWFFVFYSKVHWKKIVYSLAFGTWISFYYLTASYSGIVQYLGIYARYTPPPFVIFGIFLISFIWWITHSLGFYIGIEMAELLKKKFN